MLFRTYGSSLQTLPRRANHPSQGFAGNSQRVGAEGRQFWKRTDPGDCPSGTIERRRRLRRPRTRSSPRSAAPVHWRWKVSRRHRRSRPECRRTRVANGTNGAELPGTPGRTSREARALSSHAGLTCWIARLHSRRATQVPSKNSERPLWVVSGRPGLVETELHSQHRRAFRRAPGAALCLRKSRGRTRLAKCDPQRARSSSLSVPLRTSASARRGRRGHPSV